MSCEEDTWQHFAQAGLMSTPLRKSRTLLVREGPGQNRVASR